MVIYFILMMLILVLIIYVTNKNKEKEKFGLVDVDDIMFKKKTGLNIYDFTKA